MQLINGQLNLYNGLNTSGSTTITGSVNITGSLTASLTNGYTWVGNANNVSTLVSTSSFGGSATIPAGTVSGSSQLSGTTITNLTVVNLTTVNQTASVVFSSGSNTFGDAGNDIHSFTGSVQISGSLTITGSVTAANGFTGSLLGTASFALNGSSNAIMYQTASAASVWTFNHFLATQYPVITVYDNSNSVIIPQSITTIDSSSLTITFSSARTGVAVASKGGYVGSAVGTATTANALSTARLINNTTFDGTQNITIQNIVSGSSQLTSSYDTRYALSSSVGNVSIVTFNSQTGSYTLAAGDTGKIIRINSSVSCSVTLPDNTSVPIVTGSFFTIEQVGTGSVTAVTGSGVTILPPARTTFGQYKVIQCYKTDTNVWNVLGGIV